MAFVSSAPNLVPGDTNGVADVFLADRQAGTVRRVSLRADGSQAARRSLMPALSTDAAWLAFRSDEALTSEAAPLGGLYVLELATGRLTLVAADTDAGKGFNIFPSISGDGSRVAYESRSDGSGSRTATVIALWERAGGSTRAVAGSGLLDAEAPALSGDGGTLVFTSRDASLAPGGTGTVRQIYSMDLLSGRIARESQDDTGVPGDGDSGEPAVSSDGRFVAFTSAAANLVPGDVDLVTDVFVRDRVNQTIAAATRVNDVLNHPGDSSEPSLSGDGRLVAFSSRMSTLVPGDTNYEWDIFVHDVVANATRRVSLDAAGGQSARPSWSPKISANGAWVTFTSEGALAPDDTNGIADVYVTSAAGASHPDHPTTTPGGGHPTVTSDPHQPTSTVDPHQPTATPDGHHGPTATADGHHATATPDGHGPTATPDGHHGPTATPDGHHGPTATSDGHHGATATPHPHHGSDVSAGGRRRFLPGLHVSG